MESERHIYNGVIFKWTWITTDLNVGNFHSIYKISNSIEDGTVHWFYVYEIHTGGFWYSLDILYTIQKMEKKRGKKEKIS